MNTSINKYDSSRKTTIYSALLFGLAVMLLVVSCPLKKLLQSNFVAYSVSSVRSTQTNINQPNVADSNTANCYAVKNNVVLKFTAPQQLKIPAFTNLPYISIQAGFGLDYLLQRIHFPFSVSVSSFHSALPLFLQHLRLLI